MTLTQDHTSGSSSHQPVLVSIVVSIPACHAGDRGSIPRRGGAIFLCWTVLQNLQVSKTGKAYDFVEGTFVGASWVQLSLSNLLQKASVPGWARTTNLSVNSRTR